MPTPWLVVAACAGAVVICSSAAATSSDQSPSIVPHVSGLSGSNGWYRSDVRVTWTVSDAAGIRESDGCGPRVLSKDTPGTTLRCSASTNASPPLSRSVKVTIRIDKTAPVLAGASVASGDGANTVQWSSTSASDVAVVERSLRGASPGAPEVVYRGSGGSFTDTGIRNGVEYAYAVRTYDEAGNASSSVLVRALPRVLLPQKLPYVPRVETAPILRWKAVRGATYYHLQLFRGGKRILAAWPLRPETALRPGWSWGGRRYRLEPGTYRWYVWAGVGRRSEARYRRVGTAAFQVVAGRAS